MGLISNEPLKLKLYEFCGPCAPAYWPLCHFCAKIERQSPRSLFNVKDKDKDRMKSIKKSDAEDGGREDVGPELEAVQS